MKRKVKSGKIIVVICILFLAVGFSTALRAAEAPPSPLPPQAQQALNKGLRAVEQKEWNLAVRYFEEARKAAPAAPKVLFNLGLSESMVPGRELRSIAWFQAYLAAVPSAANATAVKEMIDKLEVRVEGTMGRLAGQAKQIAGQFPQESDRFTAYSTLAQAMAHAGDRSGATQLASLIPNTQENNLAAIARELARAGDIAGAKTIAPRIEAEPFKSSAFQDIACIQAEGGDIAGARATMENSTYPGYRHNGMIAIARALYKKGEKEEAWRTLAKAAEGTMQSAGKYSSSFSRDQQAQWEQERKGREYNQIGRAQAEIGDIRGALRTADLIPQQGTVYNTNARGDITGSKISSEWGDQHKGDIYSAILSAFRSGVLESSNNAALIQEAAARIKKENEKANLLSLLDGAKYKAVEERLRSADTRGALNTAAGIVNAQNKSKAYEAVARYFLGKGDLSSARAQLESISDAGIRTQLSINLARKFAGQREERKARELLSRARDLARANKDNWTLLSIVEVQAKAGDFDGAMETAAGIPGNDTKGYAYEKIAKAQLDNDDLSGAKKTAGLMANDEHRHAAMRSIADKEAEAGRIEDAKRTATAIPEQVHRDKAFFDIARRQARRGDFLGALNTVELIKKETEKHEAYLTLAQSQLGAGYAAAARAVIGKAKELAGRISDPAARAEAYCRLASTMMVPFYLSAEAREFLTAAAAAASLIADPKKRSEIQGYGVNRSQESAGLFTGFRESLWAALDSAQLMKDDRNSRFRSLATLEARRDDLTGAQKTAAMIGERSGWENALKEIASEAAANGDLKAAEEIAGRIRSLDRKDNVYAKMVRMEAQKGRLDEAQGILARIRNQSALDEANQAIAIAYLKAGNVANAKVAVARMKREPSDALIEAMAKAGAVDWAWQTLENFKNDSRESWCRYIAEALAGSGDLARAKKAAVFIKDPYYTGVICGALAKAGDLSWAMDRAAGIKNVEYRYQAYWRIALAMTERRDAAGAKRVLETMKKGGLTTSKARNVAEIQVKMGDIAAARETLAAIHPKDAEFESWAAYFIALCQPEGLWEQTAAGIKDDFWKTKAFSEKAQSLKDRSAAIKAASGIPDPSEKSRALRTLAYMDFSKGNLSGTAEIARLIPEPEFKMMVLSRLVLLGIKRTDVPPVLPLIQQLPDSPGKAYILLDTAAALAEAGNPSLAAQLFSASAQAARTMPDTFWKARLFAEIAKAAKTAGDQGLAGSASQSADTAAAALKEKDNALWANYRAQPKPPDLGQLEAAALQKKQTEKRTEKWTKFIEGDLSKPLFMDIQSYVQSVAAKPKPWDIFNGFIHALKDTAAMLKKSKELAVQK